MDQNSFDYSVRGTERPLEYPSASTGGWLPVTNVAARRAKAVAIMYNMCMADE